MKYKCMVMVLMLIATCGLCAEMFDVKVGDDVKKVYEVLGEPDSYMLAGNKAVVTYERGKIELVSNKVTRVDFTSVAKAAELKLKIEKANEERHDYLLQAGTALKQRKLEDARFLSLPLSDQLDFWRSFRRRYPMVDLAPVDIADMATKAAEESKQQHDEELEAELLRAKWKLMEAEERAHKAELEASSRYTRSSYGYTSYIWPPRVIIPGRPCYPVRPTPYGCTKPVSPFRPGGGTSIVGGSRGSAITVSPNTSCWPSHTPRVFNNIIR